MQANKDNFYFRHTQGDAVSERAVKMVDSVFIGFDETYYGKVNGTFLNGDHPSIFIIRGISSVTPAQAIRLMEGGEVDSVKVDLDNLESALSLMQHDLNCASRLRCLPPRKCDCFKSGIDEILQQFRPIQPAPPTAEQELLAILGTYVKEMEVRNPLYLKLLNWHTKQQPKEVDVTDCEILNMYAAFGSSKQTEDYEDIIALVRWALARAKGKDV